MKKRNVLLFVLAASTLGLSSCGEKEVSPESIKIVAEDNATSVSVGETLNFTATVLPEGSVQEVSWSVTPITGEATITTAGVLTATKEGMVEVNAASYIDSNVRGTYSLKIEPAKEVAPTSLKIVGAKNEMSIDETLQLSVQVTPSGAASTVTWSSSNTEVATVSATGAVKGLSAGETTIKATSTVATSVSAEYKITVSGESVTEPTYNYEEMEISNHDTYMSAENDTPLKVEGVVEYIAPSDGDTYNCWLMNGQAGYYLYGLDSSTQVLEKGKAYEIGGLKELYVNGTYEIKDIEYIKEITKTIDVITTDVTDKHPEVLDNMKAYMGGYVEVKQVATSEVNVSETKAYNLVVDCKGNDFTIRIDPSVCGDTEFAKINEKLSNLPEGYVIDAKGIMNAYGYGKPNPQLYIINADDLVVPELSDADKIQLVASSLSLPNCIDDSTKKIDLPTSVEGYSATISWSTESEYMDNEGNVKNRPSRTLDVDYTATIKLNEETLTKDFTITLCGSETLTTVHTFDLEDADPENKYGCSNTKSGYAEGTVELGSPKATWNLKNCLIGGTDSDVREGMYGLRVQSNKDATKTGQIELRTDFEFSTVDFEVATYGSDVLGGILIPKYSIDGGETWKSIDREYIINSRTLETIRVVIPETSATMRFQLTFKENTGKRLNIDNIQLLK